jgi:hypothetical protein
MLSIRALCKTFPMFKYSSSTLQFPPSRRYHLSPQIRELWRVVIPEMGFTTDYILDGIFALAVLKRCGGPEWLGK